MEYFHVHVFGDSFGPIIALLNEHDVKYQIRETRSGAVMAASGVIELLQSAAMWGALATIVVTFIKSRNGRKVTITTKDNEVTHAEGLSQIELEGILQRSKSLVAIDPNKTSKNGNERWGNRQKKSGGMGDRFSSNPLCGLKLILAIFKAELTAFIGHS